MSTVRRQVRIESRDPFTVVLNRSGGRPSVVLRTAPDADEATVVFYVVGQLLARQQDAGELHLLVQHGEELRTLLWEPLA